jgi:acyl carrier protein
MSKPLLAASGLSLAITFGVAGPAHTNYLVSSESLMTGTGHAAKRYAIRRIQDDTSGKTNVFERIRNILIEHLGIDAAKQKLDGSSRLISDLGADSLDIVEVVMAIEEAFKIEISDDSWLCKQNDRSLDELVRFVTSSSPTPESGKSGTSPEAPGMKPGMR